MAKGRDARGRFVATPAVPGITEPSAEDAPAGPSEDFLTELRASWVRHGAATIDLVRRDRPHDYLRLMASSLSKQVEAKDDVVEAMSDDEINDELRKILDQLAAAGAEPGA